VHDRDGGSVGGELQQLDLVGREVAPVEAADVEHADDIAVDDEWDAEERLDSLLAQERVHDVCMVDITQHDRPALGRNSPREALAKRDAGPATDLFLDSDRGPRDQLFALRVEKEDRAGVDVEQGPRALEQRAEELLELEVTQGRVGQLLQTAQLPGIWAQAAHLFTPLAEYRQTANISKD